MAEPAAAKKRILVMDDDDALRALVVDVLTAAGHDVRGASGGKEGLRHHRENPFDLVVVDLFMPEGDGLWFLNQVRPKVSGLPVVAISGGSPHLGIEALDLARLLGASRRLAKPFLPQEMVAAVAELLAAPGGPAAPLPPAPGSRPGG
jgi:DNA-binding response OmpR family regulator